MFHAIYVKPLYSFVGHHVSYGDGFLRHYEPCLQGEKPNRLPIKHANPNGSATEKDSEVVNAFPMRDIKKRSFEDCGPSV